MSIPVTKRGKLVFRGGLTLPHTIICAWCKTIISEGGAIKSHGICHECKDTQFPTLKTQGAGE